MCYRITQKSRLLRYSDVSIIFRKYLLYYTLRAIKISKGLFMSTNLIITRSVTITEAQLSIIRTICYDLELLSCICTFYIIE